MKNMVRYYDVACGYLLIREEEYLKMISKIPNLRSLRFNFMRNWQTFGKI